MELAIEWFGKEIRKKAVTIDEKASYVRLGDVIWLVGKAFGDV